MIKSKTSTPSHQKKVCLIRYIEQNFAKIIHDVALDIERHNVMSMPILAVLL